MRRIRAGDVVTRRSYGHDIFFKVSNIVRRRGQMIAVLKGMEVRLVADAPLDDLELKGAQDIQEFRYQCIQRSAECMKKIHSRRQKMQSNFMRGKSEQNAPAYFEIPGTVLHLDGDAEYLQKCLDAYRQLNLNANGFAIPEREQPRQVAKYLRKYTPDILVLTGHDAYLKESNDFKSLDSYRHSRYFMDAVREARQLEPSRDDLVIFAGACQSHFEALIEAGANFASAPQRVLIHAFDPVFIVQKIAYTPIDHKVSLETVIAETITGTDGIGGIETRGRFRLGYPKSPY